MALLYLEMKADLEHFLNFNAGGLYNGATGLLNKAVRHIQDMYEGRWNHLYRRQQSVTVDSTGYYVTLPSDINHIHFIANREREGGQLRRESDYFIETSSPTVLTSAPTKKIRFWYPKTANSTMYMNYWRLWKEFADSTSEQYPDVPNSGDAILKTARFLGLQEDEGAVPQVIEYWRGQSLQSIRDLKSIDGGYDIEEAAPFTDLNLDVHEVELYNPLNGGEDQTGRNYTGPSALKA